MGGQSFGDETLLWRCESQENRKKLHCSYCSVPGNGHRGVQRYGYDFDMNIGTQFVAARAGTVAEVEESHRDGQVGDSGLDNYIAVRHADGTVAIYGHITRDGAIVSVGAVVQQGATLGMSGNTGNTNNIPHLHLSVHSCDPVTGGSAGCPSIPVTFRNTDTPAGSPGGKELHSRSHWSVVN